MNEEEHKSLAKEKSGNEINKERIKGRLFQFQLLKTPLKIKKLLFYKI